MGPRDAHPTGKKSKKEPKNKIKTQLEEEETQSKQ